MHCPLCPSGVVVQVGYAITALPDDFNPHRRLKKVYEERRKMVETGEDVDWGMAEALAFGTLLAEGTHNLRVHGHSGSLDL